MKSLRKFLAVVLVSTTSTALAQSSEVSIQEPKPLRYAGPVLRPFHLERRIVAPVRLTNTPRLESLVRAGNLYLSVQDVIALVLENNLDIAIQRYGPPLAQEVLRRAAGGGFLRGVDTPIAAGPTSVSLAGVSTNTTGLSGGAGVGSGGGIVIQYGPTPPNLDPFVFAYANFQHLTTPLSNTILSQTTALTNDQRQFQFGYGQQFLTGSSLQLTYGSSGSRVNSPAPFLNPATSGYLDLYLTQNLLQGFSVAVNNRNIRVAKNNIKVSDLQLRRQVITTVSAILNLYWDLVSFNEDARIKHQALAASEKLLEDNKKQVALGAIAGIEVTRAAAEVSSGKQDLLISQTNVAQQETILKNALSRTGVASPWLDEVHIIPLDKIVVPPKEDIKTAAELIQDAVQNRPELEQLRLNLQSSKINLAGTKNSLLPSLQAFADFTNNGLTGPENPLYGGASLPNPYFVGGYGNLTSQILRRNFPNYSAGFSLNIPFRNRAAQSDLVTDELQLRQTELQLQRALNQVRVEVKNNIIGLQQARARYEAAVNTRVLSEETLKAEQNRYKYGVSDITLVIQAERDLTSNQSAEIQAMANYTHARIAFDDSVGHTLDVNGISMEEAASGRVSRQSSLPESVPNIRK
jgi:outer membrane protein